VVDEDEVEEASIPMQELYVVMILLIRENHVMMEIQKIVMDVVRHVKLKRKKKSKK
jgi:hypothetical protein